MKQVLVTGGSGQVGTELARHRWPEGWEAVALTRADLDLGEKNVWTVAIFAGSLLMPAAAILAFLFTVDAWRGGAGRLLRGYAMTVSIAALIISGYLSAWGMIGFMPWNF